MRSPFCLYLTVALGLNTPPVIFAGQAFLNGGGGGCNVALIWLLVNAILCVVNMAAAIYISQKIAYDPADTEANNGTKNKDAAQQQPDIEATATPIENKTKARAQTTIFPTKIKMWPLFEFESTTTSRSKSLSRVRDVLCHDPIVAIYIVIGVGYIVWQTMGVGRMNEAADCGGGVDQLVSDALMFGFLFISLGAMAFSCSVCCLR
jgi:hypothetical protein